LPIAPHRLLGFAFASADLLLEVDGAGKIVFAIGAAAVVAGNGELSLIGHPLADFVEPDDLPLAQALFSGVESGSRQGPVAIRLAAAAGGRAEAFALSACMLPQNAGVISCAAVRCAAPQAGSADGGLFDRHEFENIAKTLFETGRATGQALELAFVEMDGLLNAERALAPARRKDFKSQVAGVLKAQSHGGAAAAKLDDERYALVRPSGEASDALTRRVSKLMSVVAAGAEIKVGAHTMELKGDVAPSQMVKALRYALDDFIETGIAATTPLTLQEAVGESVRHTLAKASALGAAVSEKRFQLVYQPVVTLKTGALHHHEVLVRFGEDASPFPMIRMAEELDLIEELDLAVARQAADQMLADSKLKLAVNLSGRTIVSPGFIAQATAMLNEKPALKHRMLFEITESAAIEDMGLANKHIQTLRGLGCKVCLDDFGAGAASLAYLQQLHLDLVKIDGRYIRELQHGGRESTFIRHLVQMCAELGVQTVAEMVETTSSEDAVRQAGVDFGQGYLYGAPAPKPEQPIDRRGPPAARRVGAVDSWG
jgi:EAL domain-containing protein (putative c-di-GMP-specific phosphodiesterase class I)